MKYNGHVLEEMTPELWDGKSREMLVWDSCDETPYERTVIGCIGAKSWFTVDFHEDRNIWSHCAEIPKEESTQEYNIDEMIKVLNAYKEGKPIEGRNKATSWSAWYGLLTPTWNFKDYEYRIANEQQIKKTRIMTNKELSKWLAQGNGAMRWSSHERAPVTTEFVYDEHQENYTVASGIIIRGFDEKEWHKPLIEV